MDSKEMSDLSLNRKECPKCGAIWINGDHYWSGTGKRGNELDLAGLVCNNTGDDTCINSSRGLEGGVTWKKRHAELEKDFPKND